MLILLLSLAHASTVLYANDFETPNLPLVANCGPALDANTIDTLWGYPGFNYQQLYTVEGVLHADALGQYRNPMGLGGDYSVGMLSDYQDDRLALTFDRLGLPFINVGLRLSAIDTNGCGGPFGVGTPTMHLILHDSPSGVFNWGDPVLGEAWITGMPSPDPWTFRWVYGTADLDASAATGSWITVEFDMQDSGYATFDDLSIVASAAGGVVDTDTDGLPDDVDNCPMHANANQADADLDTIGDACDHRLDAHGVCPGPTRFDAWGLTPNGSVVIASSAVAGNLTIGSGGCAGTVTGLGAGARVHRTVTADANGEIHMTGNLPGMLCGRVAQMLDVSACEVTNTIGL